MTDTVKFANWDDDFGHTPVEPQLLSLLARQRLDDLLSRPTPSVLDALSTHSVSLYDLGVRAGMDWRRRSDNDVHNRYNNPEYLEYERMSDKLRNARAHTADCKHLAYIEGWLNGWHAVPEIEGTPHQVNRGAY